MCHSELGEATLYILRDILVAQRNAVLIGSTSEMHSLIRVRGTWIPSPLKIPLIMFCPASGIECFMCST